MSDPNAPRVVDGGADMACPADVSPQAGYDGRDAARPADRSPSTASASGWVVVARCDELPPGRLKRVGYGDAPVVLANVEGQLYALSDTCQHHGASLAEGALRGTSLICAWHAWRYDAPTGRLVNPPSNRLRLTTYPVRLAGDQIAIGPPTAE